MTPCEDVETQQTKKLRSGFAKKMLCRLGVVGAYVVPTVFWSGPYRMFFYSSDGHEPMHVHVERDKKVAKFWLTPVCLEISGGFSKPELHRIAGIIRDGHDELIRAWDEYFQS